MASIQLAGRRKIIGGVYLQSCCNAGSDRGDDFDLQLNEISAMIIEETNASTDFMLLGDFNTCPDREYMANYPARSRHAKPNRNSRRFTRFINRFDFKVLDLEFGTGPTYTFTGPRPHFSKTYIDHVLASDQFFADPMQLTSCTVLNEHFDNFSDHLPISISMSIDFIPRNDVEIPRDVEGGDNLASFIRTKYHFHKKENGIVLYDTLMSNAMQNDLILERLDQLSSTEKFQYLCSLVKKCAQDTDNSLGRNVFTNRFFTSKYWWTPILSELRDKTRDLYDLIPFNAESCSIATGTYRLAKRAYKNEVRRVKKQLTNKYFVNLDKAKSKKPKQFWKALGKKRNSSQQIFNINGMVSVSDINSELCRTFGERLNDLNALDPQQRTVSDAVTEYAAEIPEQSDTPFFSDDLVELCVQKLHSNRAADSQGITAELIKVCSVPALTTIIASMLNSIVNDGHVPFEMSHSVIIPLIKKPQKGTIDPNNYRGISLVSIFSKIFELALLEKFPIFTKTSSLQHGFKKQESCAHAAYTVRETIKVYTANSESRLFMCSLDAEKAFDKVWWDGLFFKLKPILPHSIWSLLYNYYGASTFQVTYSEKLGEIQSMSCGVKQGGILSPHLFTFFINELLLQLQSSGYGTRVGLVFTGAIAYADDIILISQTAFGLQQMIDMSCLYCSTWKIKLNAPKTEIICFNTEFERNKMTFNLDGNQVKLSKQCTHLGFEWHSDDKHILFTHLMKKFTSFSISTISLIKRGLQSCHPNSIAFLIKNQLISLLYGIEFCEFSKTMIRILAQKLRSLYKSCFRCSKHCSNALLRVFNLPSFLEIVHTRALTTRRCIMNNAYTEEINSYVNSTFHSDMFSELENDFPLPVEPPNANDELAENLKVLVTRWSEPVARKTFLDLLHRNIVVVVD
jgi:hypothetical protein